MKRIYLDNAATTPTDPRVKEAMEPYWSEKFGNASSIHSEGQEALDAVESARKSIADLLNAQPQEIVFTSGGTESDNAAIKGAGYALKDKGNHIITSKIEHHAVLHACEFMASQGFELTLLPVDQHGLVDPADVREAIKDGTVLITIMHANNEIGTLQPIAEIGAIAKERGVLFHTDAVQTFGHLPIDVQKMNIDLLSLSAHKLYGPNGVGALYIRKGTPFVPFMHGGAQEAGRRASTHNVPGIVGLGKATEIAAEVMKPEDEKIAALRDRLRDNLFKSVEGIHLNGHLEKRLSNNLNISIEHVEGESLLMNLDMEGIAASSGSACSSGSTEPSHVLSALGLSTELARGSLRLTLGRFTTQEEIQHVSEALPRIVKHLRSLSSFGGDA